MNCFTEGEIYAILAALGASSVRYHGNSIRCTCPIHGGEGSANFSVFRDDFGFPKASCFSRGCVAASSLEWVVAKSMHLSLADAVAWLSALLNRPDLEIPTNQRPEVLAVKDPKPVEVENWDSIRRLQTLHPYHNYWRERGYSDAIVKEYGFTFRSIDNRAVVPVFNGDEVFVGAVTRKTLPDELDLSPKYLWESHNNKGDFIFGMPQARRRSLVSKGKRCVFLVEGTLDVVKGAMMGFPLVATQTNRLSNAQVRELLEWDSVIIVPDNDEAGERLVDSAAKYLSPFVDLAVAYLQDAKDLDSLDHTEVSDFLSTTFNTWSKECRTSKLRKFTVI